MQNFSLPREHSALSIHPTQHPKQQTNDHSISRIKMKKNDTRSSRAKPVHLFCIRQTYYVKRKFLPRVIPESSVRAFKGISNKYHKLHYTMMYLVLDTIKIWWDYNLMSQAACNQHLVLMQKRISPKM